MVTLYFMSILTPEQVAAAKGWIAALRSGNYAQGHRALRTEKGFCCLGVASDILNPEAWRNTNVAWFRWEDPIEGSFWGGLSVQAANHFGLAVGAQDLLVNANDDLGMSFEEIAADLENDLKRVRADY